MLIVITLGILLIIALQLVQVVRKNQPDNSNEKQFDSLRAEFTKIEKQIRDEFSLNRTEIRDASRAGREEQTNSFRNLSTDQKIQLDQFAMSLNDLNATIENKVEKLIKTNEQSLKASHDNIDTFRKEIEAKLEKIRETIELKLRSLQEDNSKKLEEMRVTVDEKLHATLERRFNESFNIIGERLEQVHKGLGEMQSLATGVGDLKKVLTNVKSRGTFAEFQLGEILGQFLSPEQFEKNVSVRKGSAELVEFAIKIPSKTDDNTHVLLPLDSKFPKEDYERLIEAIESSASQDIVNKLSAAFESSIKKEAKRISEKYINAPITTDFAMLFVPTEGLYAEIVRRKGLVEALQHDYKISVVGPTNLVAFVQSLQMGFRTLAIQKRSSEVWDLLGAIKTQFGDFGLILDATRKKLQEAANKIDDASKRTRVIEKKLRSVEELPLSEALTLLNPSADSVIEDSSDDTLALL
ncbi:MAG: DNA recombination protein RmuC [bacterium]